MSLSLLLEKYDVSTDEGLQKALNEIEKEELEVDEALSGVLSRACSLEGRLRTASQAYTRLSEVKTDAQLAADMVEKTADLARDVSAKVRQLDLARSRVAECQRRVHDLIDLQLCSAGVEAAIKSHDYETAAGHVSRYLSMDPGSVAAARARGAHDPRDAMTRAANTLRDHLIRKFEEAARKEDEASVERLFKLFPQIGCAEEGVNLLAKYLAAKTEASIRVAAARVPAGGGAGGAGGGEAFAGPLTRVLEAAAAGVERARALAAAAPGLLPAALRALQPTVCAGAGAVCAGLQRSARAAAARRGPALALEPALADLALSLARITLYFNFLRRKAQADAAPLNEAGQKKCLDEVEKIIADCDLTRTAQDLLGLYLELERSFLEDSVSKALKMATPQTGATTSTLVDDVFFIARKVIRRSISTGSVDGACAVLNEVCASLERWAAAALRRWLRAPPPDPLPLAPPRAPHHAPHALLDAAGDLAARLNRDLDAQRLLFLAHLSEAEAGAEWSERLAGEAVAEGARAARTAAERDKLASCAAGLAAAAEGFRAARDLALAGLLAALKPRLVAWADALADPGAETDEMEDDADALPMALEQFVENARAHISSSAIDSLLYSMLVEIVTRAENKILHNHYDRAGGLSVERRARRVAAWAGAAGVARERAARLAQCGALLALDAPAHAADALPPAALHAPSVRDVLARRTDFKIEDIKRLKF